jgi:hypothetical protein
VGICVSKKDTVSFLSEFILHNMFLSVGLLLSEVAVVLLLLLLFVTVLEQRIESLPCDCWESYQPNRKNLVSHNHRIRNLVNQSLLGSGVGGVIATTNLAKPKLGLAFNISSKAF